MAALARTPVLPEATPLGALSADCVEEPPQTDEGNDDSGTVRDSEMRLFASCGEG
jgi:hypothetical protein